MKPTTPRPDLEVVPDLTQLRLPPKGQRKPSSRRARKVEAALVRAEDAVRRSAHADGPPPLVVLPQREAPHVRLGLGWAAVTLGATIAGRGWLAAWLAIAAAVAAGQLAKVWRGRGARPVAPVAMALAGALPLAAIGGAGPAANVLMAGVVVALAAQLLAAVRARAQRPTRDAAFTLAAAIPVGVAAAAPVLVRSLGLTETVVLFAFVWAFDAAAYLVGSGASAWWEGAAAGAVATLPVTLVVAALLVNPFGGTAPWLLGLAAAIGAPAGVRAGAVLLADTADAPAPGLRRLDSLMIFGPLYAFAAAVLLG